MFFDVGPLKLVTLVVIAVLIFGPDRIPALVAQAAAILRQVREFSDSAKQDIRNELGPEFKNFEFEDLNPRTLVRKQLAAHGQALGLSESAELKDVLVQGDRTDPPVAPAAASDTDAT